MRGTDKHSLADPRETMNARARRLLHFAVAGLFYYSGGPALLRFFRRRILRQNEVCVLGLHRVLTRDEWSRSNSLDGMVITDVTFERLLEDLQRQFQVVSLETLLQEGSSDTDRQKPWCVVTFDDGWRDTYTRAYPSLKKFGMAATVFIASGSIEHRGGFWVERLNKAWKVSSSRARIESVLGGLVNRNTSQLRELENIVEWLKRMPMEKRDLLLMQMLPSEESSDDAGDVDSMMTWKQVIEISRNGMEIGAHTVSHPLLTYEDDTTVERELRASKQTLEQKVGKNVRSFAYPNGDCDERVRRSVEQAGYNCAFTTRPGWYNLRQDCYSIRRILLHEGNLTGIDGQYSPAMLSLTLAGRV
jgi:peptidoglycan/xylan/chitin deacetylase (PgdA/CDA1 family)